MATSALASMAISSFAITCQDHSRYHHQKYSNLIKTINRTDRNSNDLPGPLQLVLAIGNHLPQLLVLVHPGNKALGEHCRALFWNDNLKHHTRLGPFLKMTNWNIVMTYLIVDRSKHCPGDIDDNIDDEQGHLRTWVRSNIWKLWSKLR